MKERLLLLFITNLCLFNIFFAQVNDITSPCDCVDLAIKNQQLVEDGYSEFNSSKILENQNKKCVELKNTLGQDFEKEIILCENFSVLSEILSFRSSEKDLIPEICNCVKSSISILQEIKNTGDEASSIKKYRNEAESCEVLRSKYSNEDYAQLMTLCPDYKKLMNLMISLRK